MRTSTLILLAACSAGTLFAQSAKEVADNLTMPELKPGDKRLTLPEAQGAQVRILGADYEQIIDNDGRISPVISDTPVNISFEVTKDGKKAISKDYTLTVKAPAADENKVNPKPLTVPALLEWKGGKGQLKPAAIRLAADKDIKNLPLQEISEELNDSLAGADKPESTPTTVKLNLVKNSAYKLGQEGYVLKISHNGVTITGCSEQALYWGTRSLAQMLRLHDGSLPCGTAVDIPRYPLRGFMLDVGRIPVPIDYLYDVVRTMAWYKMNDLHLHLNDNYIFHENYVDAGKDPFVESYDGFRMESDIKSKDGRPITSQDLYYTKRGFRELIDFARARGVNIVPEFDTPGHALSFTRTRPDLIYQGKMNNPKRRCEMLDASNPEALKFVGEVWDEYLKPDKKLGRAVFEGCTVHIGADEFYGENEDYRKYMDGLVKFVISRGYTPRVWGSLNKKPGKTPVRAEGVQLNLWNGGWAKAWDSVNQGFDVINTNDGALYIVPFADYYRMDQRPKQTYNNWKPNVIGGETLPAGHPQLLGATFAIWNDMTDMRHNGYAPYDIWGQFSNSADILSQKMWGTAQIPCNFEEHKSLIAKLGVAPGTNPYYLPTWSEYKLERPVSKATKLRRGSVGPNYHLSMELTLKAAPEGHEQVLLSSPAGQLLAVNKEGNIGMRRNDSLEFQWEAKLPVGKKVKLELIGKPGSTELFIDGKKAEGLTMKAFKGGSKQLKPTFILPLQTLAGSFNGEVSSLTVTHEVPPALRESIKTDAKEPAAPSGDAVGTPGSGI